jgi:pheromone shutdown-related protein TraB
VSETSVEDVREAIERHEPETVAVELDASRRDALEDRNRWADTPVTEIIRGGKAPLVLAQVVLSNYQRRIAEETGVEPGADMKAALEAAEAAGSEVVLADRDLGVTLQRAWRKMGWRERARVGWELWKGLLGVEGTEDVDVDELLEEDVVTQMMEELAEFAPSVSEVLVDERDAYLASKIQEAREATDGTVLAVVGAGHLDGVQAYLEDPAAIPDREGISHVPEPRFRVGRAIGWAFSAVIAVAFAWFLYDGIRSGDFTRLRENLVRFYLITGIPSAVGATLAAAHPLSIATAFVAAPVGIAHPAIATGWFAGAVEAWRRTPTVADFEGLAEIETIREFYGNNLTRVLLVTALTNLGAMVGFFLAGGFLAQRLQELLAVLASLGL